MTNKSKQPEVVKEKKRGRVSKKDKKHSIYGDAEVYISEESLHDKILLTKFNLGDKYYYYDDDGYVWDDNTRIGYLLSSSSPLTFVQFRNNLMKRFKDYNHNKTIQRL
jgi:hypothetical protein